MKQTPEQTDSTAAVVALNVSQIMLLQNAKTLNVQSAAANWALLTAIIDMMTDVKPMYTLTLTTADLVTIAVRPIPPPSVKMEYVSKIASSRLERFSRPFRFSYPEVPEELERSILTYGQISPLILSKINNTPVIISGYRRSEILKRHKIEPLVYVLKDLLWEEALCLYITENTFQRRFNPIEKIRLCHFIKSSNIRIPSHLISEAELGDIELAASLSAFESSLVEEIREFIMRKEITINTLLRLTKMEGDRGIEILKLFKDLNLSHSEINIMALNLYILYMRGEDIDRLIKDRDQISPMQFREIIASRVNPELLRIKAEFERFRSRFKRVNLFPPENFEGDRYKIVSHFENEEEIDLLIEDLMELKRLWRENPALK